MTTLEGEPSPKDFMVNLNRVWESMFGHSYTHCYQLSLMDGEIGRIHQAHIDFIEHRLVDGKEGTE